MRRIHLLALLVTLGGGASLLSPSPAAATDGSFALVPVPKYCCSTYWGFGHYCCGDNGCRITGSQCSRW
jgi:hypothetical protein